MPESVKGYEFVEHTADIGIRAHGATQAELFERMARGLTKLMVEDSSLQGRVGRALRLHAEDVETLLLQWLQELLFWFSTERFVVCTVHWTRLTATTLEGEVRGEIFDPVRHKPGHEVKAITRHQLAVTEGRAGWQGQVIVDI